VTIQSALAELKSVISWIDDNGKVLDIEGTPRHLLAAACFDMALEHQAAIAVLFENELQGSAFALLRVMAEAYFRGEWIARCATDAEIERFQRDQQISKSLKIIVDEVETAMTASPGILAAMVDIHWAAFCSFMHTGYRQVTRRYTGPLFKPSYPEAEVIRSINFAGAIGLMTMIDLATLSKNDELARATLERARTFATRKRDP
jgi:hypothetical protein